MALRTSEDEDTRLNPGQADSDQRFNSLSNAEKSGNFEDTPNKSVDNSKKTTNIDNAREGEDNPAGPSASGNDFINNFTGNKGSSGKGFNKVSFLNKKGPIAGIIVTLVAAGIGVTGLTSIPALLIIQIKETLTKSLNDADPALSSRSTLMLARKISSVGNAFTETADGKCGIKCKFGTINETMKRNMEAPGNKFKVEFGDKKFGGRYVIKSLTFPDGHTVTNSADFKNALKDPARASSFNKIFNSKTAYFLNSKFSSILRTKFGLDKLAEWSGNTKEKAIASLRKVLGLQGDTAATDPLLKLTPEERARSGPLKPVMEAIDTAHAKAAGKITSIAGGACAVYDTSKTITFAEKAKKIAAFAAFAMIFLKLADQIKAGDNPDPAVVEQAGNQLTQYETNATNADGTPNTNYGKSATDAIGYRMANYQDTAGTLSVQDQPYSAAPSNSLASVLSTLTGYLVGAGTAGISSARALCKLANNPALSVTASCGPELAAAAASIETGVGPIVAGLECIGKTALTIGAMSYALGVAVSKVVSAIVSSGEIRTPDETTIGPPVLNATYTGAASILGGQAAGYGLHAGTEAQIKTYAIDTASIKNQNEAIARYDARNTPFDIQNQYSFLGTLVRSTGFITGKSASILSHINSVTSLIPKSFASLSNPTSAASVVTAADAKANLYNNACQDQSLKSIGVDADALCNPSYVMSGSELNADSNAVIDYMVNKNYIDSNTGNVIAGSPYQKYLDNCANRIDPLGETSASITDDDYEWKVGLRCTETSDDLTNFRVYTMDKSVNDTMDGDTESSSPPTITTGTVDSALLHSDSSSVACDSRTTDGGIQDGYYQKNLIKIHTCQVPELSVAVNAIISKNTADMVVAMKTSGVLDGATSGFRTMASQTSLYNRYQSGSGNLAAVPGTSNHQMGLAVDFKMISGTSNSQGSCVTVGGVCTISGDATYGWLKANAVSYGFTQDKSEFWHWEMK